MIRDTATEYSAAQDWETSDPTTETDTDTDADTDENEGENEGEDEAETEGGQAKSMLDWMADADNADAMIAIVDAVLERQEKRKLGWAAEAAEQSNYPETAAMADQALAHGLDQEACREYLTGAVESDHVDPAARERLTYLTDPGRQLDAAELRELDQRLGEAYDLLSERLYKLETGRGEGAEAAQQALFEYCHEILYQQCADWPLPSVDHLDPAQNAALQECIRNRICGWRAEAGASPDVEQLIETAEAVKEYAADPAACPAWFNPDTTTPVNIAASGEDPLNFRANAIMEDRTEDETEHNFRLPNGFRGNWVHPRPIDLTQTPEEIGHRLQADFDRTEAVLDRDLAGNGSAIWFAKKLLLCYVNPNLMDKLNHFEPNDDDCYEDGGWNMEEKGREKIILKEPTNPAEPNETATSQDHREISYARAVRDSFIEKGIVDDVIHRRWDALGHSLPRAVLAINRLDQYLTTYGSMTEADTVREQTREQTREQNEESTKDTNEGQTGDQAANRFSRDQQPGWNLPALENFKRILALAPASSDESDTAAHRARWPEGYDYWDESTEHQEAAHPETELGRLIEQLSEIGRNYTQEELTNPETVINQLKVAWGIGAAADPDIDLDHPRRPILQELGDDLYFAGMLLERLQEYDFEAANGKFRRQREREMGWRLHAATEGVSDPEAIAELTETWQAWTQEPGDPQLIGQASNDLAAQLYEILDEDTRNNLAEEPNDGNPDYNIDYKIDYHRLMLLHRISQRLSHADWLSHMLNAERRVTENA